MTIRLFQIDTFTNQLFKGNPAAVCPLETWLSDDLLQNIAAENNLSETAFYVKNSEGYHLRWFTPTTEVELCGHATLAAAFVIFQYQAFPEDTIKFQSCSGILSVKKNGDYLVLDFPADVITETELSEGFIHPFNESPIQAFKGRIDYLLVFKDETTIMNLEVNIPLLSKIEARGIIATARGTKSDFVSRFFAPRVGVDEDPVTGSAHTTLVPYWSQQLNRYEFTARQLSKRGGLLQCRLVKDRVEIGGKAVGYLQGDIILT